MHKVLFFALFMMSVSTGLSAQTQEESLKPTVKKELKVADFFTKTTTGFKIKEGFTLLNQDGQIFAARFQKPLDPPVTKIKIRCSCSDNGICGVKQDDSNTVSCTGSCNCELTIAKVDVEK